MCGSDVVALSPLTISMIFCERFSEHQPEHDDRQLATRCSLFSRHTLSCFV